VIEIIKRLLDATILFLEWKGKYYYYEIHSKSREKQKEYADQIEMLRGQKTTDSSDMADLIYSYLLSEQRFMTDMSEYFTPKKNENKDNPNSTGNTTTGV